ncbi:MAG TPA: hypothetical protein VNL38_03870, partial [Candidatus Nitrosotenuis sp.]|nr:hypothetical protein [Candidatus Nitrosotenuis sp.]
HSMLNKGAKVSDAEKFLARVPAEHEFFITGPDLTPLRALGAAALKACATLQLKSSKAKIAASRAEFRQKQADEKMEAVVFHFPKNDSSGRPLISAKESGVEFVCKAGGAQIKAAFEPGRMVSREGPEF